MKFTKIYTGNDQKSHFEEVEAEVTSKQPLGNYSKVISTTGMMLREFKQGAEFDWHTAPRPQFIIYLEGEVEVQASGGESRVFRSGDILLAADLTGKGHITRTLTDGRSAIVMVNTQFNPDSFLNNSTSASESAHEPDLPDENELRVSAAAKYST